MPCLAATSPARVLDGPLDATRGPSIGTLPVHATARPLTCHSAVLYWFCLGSKAGTLVQIRVGPGMDISRQLDEALSLDRFRWNEAWSVRLRQHGRVVLFDRPTDTLPVSLTGTSCALRCAHCNGHYLQHMRPIWDLHPSGAKSCLISGGCDAMGRVPLNSHLERVAELHRERRLNWHVGLAHTEDLTLVLPYVDVISFDVVGDRETAREVYGLDLGLDDYMATYDMLRRHAQVVPHITIGLRGGRLSGERRALVALGERQPGVLVWLILIPTPGTAYAAVDPPTLVEVADLLLGARIQLPETRLYLGCMRPHGRYRQAVDRLALRAGINAIVNPSRAAEDEAEKLGLRLVWGDECCAFH